jgi:cytochrome oxidase Cu insertion factor (SCO1/SenC/PrrC family)
MKFLRPLVLAFVVLLAVSASTASRSVVDDLMMDMRITPLDRVAPPPLTVTTLDGARVELADAHGHVVLVYFWATW